MKCSKSQFPHRKLELESWPPASCHRDGRNAQPPYSTDGETGPEQLLRYLLRSASWFPEAHCGVEFTWKPFFLSVYC